MGEEDDAPTACRCIEALVYIREHGAAACPDPIGYDVSLTIGARGVETVTLRPLADPADAWTIRPGSALWRMSEAFLMVLPALRARMAMPQPQEVA